MGSGRLGSDRLGPNPGRIRFWAGPCAKIMRHCQWILHVAAIRASQEITANHRKSHPCNSKRYQFANPCDQLFSIYLSIYPSIDIPPVGLITCHLHFQANACICICMCMAFKFALAFALALISPRGSRRRISRHRVFVTCNYLERM